MNVYLINFIFDLNIFILYNIIYYIITLKLVNIYIIIFYLLLNIINKID